MKKSIRLWGTRLLLLVIGLVGVINVFPPLQPHAYAYDWQGLDAKTTGYSYYASMKYCVEALSSSRTTPYTVKFGPSINLGSHYNTTNAVAVLGFTASDGDNEDGIIDCQKTSGDFTAKSFGYESDHDKFLSDLGYVKDVANKQWVFTDGDTSANAVKSPPSANSSSSKLLARLKTVATAKNIATVVTPEINYQLARSALKGKGGSCQANITLFSELGATQSQYGTGNGKLRTASMFWPDGASGPQKVGIELGDAKWPYGLAAYPNNPGASNEWRTTNCYTVSDDISEWTSQIANTVSEANAAQTAASNTAAIKAAAAVYATDLCKGKSATPTYSTSGQSGDSPATQCASAIISCMENQSNTGGSITSQMTIPVEQMSLPMLAKCIAESGKARTKDTAKILKALQELKGKADEEAAKARANAAAGACDTTADPNCKSTDENVDPCPMPQDTVMRWLACSLITAGSGLVNGFYNAIQGFLYTPVDQIFDSTFQKVFNRFSVFGMAIIVIAGLVMVIAQATGSDLVDAYTVKKVMPRLGFAIVGIALAWPVLKLLMTLTNDLGLTAGAFISGLGSGEGGLTGSGENSFGIVWAIGLPALALGKLAVSLGAWGLLSLVGTGLLALLLGLFVLAIRQLVLIVLVLMAPLAIAASVLPGTDKLWKFWRTTLITTLAMFPLIMLFLKSGEFFARIAGNIAPETGLSGDAWAILAVIAFFAPYFMLPFAFKMTGGLVSNIFGMVNDRSKGLFDRMKNNRAETRKDRKNRAGQGHLWDPNSGFQKAMKGNTLASWVTDPKGSFAYSNKDRRSVNWIPGLKRAGYSVASKIDAGRNEHTNKLVEELTKMGYNDRAFRLLSGAHHGLEESTQGKLRDAGLLGKRIETVQDLQKAAAILASSTGKDGAMTSGAIGERTASNAILQSLGRISTLYQDSEMGRASITGAGMIGLASQGYGEADDIAASSALLSQDSDLDDSSIHSMVVQAQNVGVRGHPELKSGYGVVYDPEKRNFDEHGVELARGGYINGLTGPGGKNRAKELALRLSTQDFSVAKPESFDRIVAGISANLESGEATTVEVQKQQLFNLGGFYSTASPAFKEKVIKFIEANGLTDEFRRQSQQAPETTGGGQPPAEPAKTP